MERIGIIRGNLGGDEASDSGIEKALIWSMGDDKSSDWSHAASL
jgi:hypothetical protein